MKTRIATLSSRELKAAVGRHALALVELWAPGYPACRAFAPIVEAAARRHPDVFFARLNAHAHPDVARGFGVQGVPTLLVFRDGILLFDQPGALPADTLDSLIERTRALDMDEVREELATGGPAAR